MLTETALISKLPYRNLTKVMDIIDFERPILSLFENTKNNYFLLYLFDSHVEFDQYLFWKVKIADLYSFFEKSISLRELILTDNKDFLFVIESDLDVIEDFDNLESYQRIYQYLPDEIEMDWLPGQSSFWEYAIPDLFAVPPVSISENEYVYALRNKAIYFKVEPKGKKYKSTISTWDAANFLRLITTSFIHYIIYDFQKNFNDLFDSEEGYINSLDLIKNSLTPRISDLHYGSFEVALSVDNLNPIPQAGNRYFKWQRKAIETYKRHVIEYNYNSTLEVNQILNEYPTEVRRKIFTPIFNLADNPHYTVKFSDKGKDYYEPMTIVDRETRRTITQLQEISSTDENENLELLTFVIAVPEGSNIKDIDKRKIKSNTLSFRKSDSEEIPYNEDFEFKGKRFVFLNPLTLRIATRGNYFILLCDIFSIELSSMNRDELFNNLKEEIFNYFFTKVLNHPNSPEAKVFQIYFNAK